MQVVKSYHDRSPNSKDVATCRSFLSEKAGSALGTEIRKEGQQKFKGTPIAIASPLAASEQLALRRLQGVNGRLCFFVCCREHGMVFGVVDSF